MRATVRDIQDGDAEYLAANMQGADVLEVWLAEHKTPLEAVQTSVYASSKAYTVTDGETLVSMFGVAPASLLGDVGYIWLLSTPRIKVIKKSFLAQNKEYVEKLFDGFRELVNFTHAGNARSIAWLNWLGAELREPEEHGPEKALFHYFSIRK